MPKETKTVPNGYRSRKLEAFVEKTGLPKKEDAMKDLDQGFTARFEKRLKKLREFNDEMERLFNNAHAMGWDKNLVMFNLIDLQTRLGEHISKFEENQVAYAAELGELQASPEPDQKRIDFLKEKLSETILDSPMYIKARELVGKEATNVAKLGLDAARFQRDLEKVKQRGGDDELYTVNAEVVGDE